jgi:hypothetical protein
MSIDGTYNVEIEAPMGKVTGILTLKAKGKTLSGTYEAAGGKQPLSGTVSGNEVAFLTGVGGPEGRIELDFKGTISGNEITGGARANGSDPSPFKGTKV